MDSTVKYPNYLNTQLEYMERLSDWPKEYCIIYRNKKVDFSSSQLQIISLCSRKCYIEYTKHLISALKN